MIEQCNSIAREIVVMECGEVRIRGTSLSSRATANGMVSPCTVLRTKQSLVVDLLLQDHPSGLREIICLVEHLIAVAKSSMQNQDWGLFRLHFAEAGVPDIDARGQIQILAMVAVGKRSTGRMPFPSRL